MWYSAGNSHAKKKPPPPAACAPTPCAPPLCTTPPPRAGLGGGGLAAFGNAVGEQAAVTKPLQPQLELDAAGALLTVSWLIAPPPSSPGAAVTMSSAKPHESQDLQTWSFGSVARP